MAGDSHTQGPLAGFQWPVSASQTIAAPSSRVWTAISTPGNLDTCHPHCVKNPVEVWPGPDSRDEIHYLSGWIFQRHFLRWTEGVGYDLEIRRDGNGLARVSWRVLPVDEQSCILSITVYPYALQGVPLVVRWLPHLLRLRPMLKRYLTSVVKGFEWFVIHDEAVPRDQFGRHPWFSAS